MTPKKMKNLENMPKHRTVLSCLHQHGPKNFIEVERMMGISGVHAVLFTLRHYQLINPLPKKNNRDLRVYEITQEGIRRLQALEVKTTMAGGRYIPEFQPLVIKDQTPARSGSMDAYKLKSLGWGKTEVR